MMQFTVRYHVHSVQCGSIGNLILLWFFYKLVPSATLEGILGHEGVNQCVCPGDQLTYRCTVQGSNTGGTLWTGTAFSGCQQNAIFLQHHQFTPTGGPTGSCNNGAIVGRSLDKQGNNYTSQLNVIITPETAGKTIMCAYDPLTGQNITIELSTRIPGQLPPPPPNELCISNANIVSRDLTFSWSPVAPECPAIHYNILASNCGSCPTTTNHTNVTCTDVSTNSSDCNFTVQTVLCETITGNASDPISIAFHATEQNTTPTGILHVPLDMTEFENESTYNSDTTETEGIHNSNADTPVAYPISIGVLAAALIICIVVSITVITITLRRNKAANTIIATFAELNRVERRVDDNEPLYENITGRLPSVSTVTTQDNIAYYHIQKRQH